MWLVQQNNYNIITAPQKPENFNNDDHGIIYQIDNIIIIFKWDPQARQDVVENYSITITPVPKSLPNGFPTVRQSPWIVALDYNIIYNVSIAAVNCAGRSETVSIENIEHGKWIRV